MSKIAALLNMLSSDNDGERINAARLLTAMAKKENKTIADLVMSPQVVYRDRIVEKTVYKERERFDDDDLRGYRPPPNWNQDRPRPGPRKPKTGGEELIAGLRWARDFPEYLNGFEVEFIDDVLRFNTHDYQLSARQEKVARKIVRKVQANEGEPLI